MSTSPVDSSSIVSTANGEQESGKQQISDESLGIVFEVSVSRQDSQQSEMTSRRSLDLPGLRRTFWAEESSVGEQLTTEGISARERQNRCTRVLLYIASIGIIIVMGVLIYDMI